MRRILDQGFVFADAELKAAPLRRGQIFFRFLLRGLDQDRRKICSNRALNLKAFPAQDGGEMDEVHPRAAARIRASGSGRARISAGRRSSARR